MSRPVCAEGVGCQVIDRGRAGVRALSNLQRRLDEDMRGRVRALWSMAFLGSRPLAGSIDGAVADLASPRLGVQAAVGPLAVGWWALHRVGLADDGDRVQLSAT